MPQPFSTSERCSINDSHNDAIAIIGMAARLAQDADTNENLWKFLLRNRNAMTPFPEDRLNHESHYHPDAHHGATVSAHFMAGDPAAFDSQFFTMSNTEVMTMDPQQRIMMENVYHALENAGIPLNKVTSSMTSVFASGFNHDFHQVMSYDPELSVRYKITGTANSILANRISWFYDFKAASVTVDTACSSSMVAFDLACQNLKQRESEMAIISAVNFFMWPNDSASLSSQGFLSPDGQSYSFDHRANGYSRGEGVGTMILKRLDDALRDGDTIRAVVRATGVNQDGRTSGLTLPNGTAQAALIREVYMKAGLDPNDTPFIEAHGTGTAVGDPIEARGIAEAFQASDRTEPLYIGALKSALGHLEGAAGIAGLIKSVMILESGIIPPNYNFEQVNPKFSKEWNFCFPVKPTPWPKQGKRRVSINSFGFGGTNAHIILDDAASYLESRDMKGFHTTIGLLSCDEEQQRNGCINREYSDVTPQATCKTSDENSESKTLYDDLSRNEKAESNGNKDGLSAPLLFLFSAFDEKGVSRNMESLVAHLKSLPAMTEAQSTQYMVDLAHTIHEKRSLFRWRSFCIASTLKELVCNLAATQLPSTRANENPNLGFVFTGQGAQWYAMGRELFIYPTFRNSLMAADRYISSLGCEWSLLDELHKSQHDSRVNQPAISLIACVALQIAVVELLASWNIFPARVVGHSSGEVPAAYSAGKLGRRSAWKIAYFRGALVSAMTPTPPGSMMAVGLSDTNLMPYLEKVNNQFEGELSIACYNSPTNNTVSGDEVKIDALKTLLDADSVFNRKLAVSHAYHSRHMDIIAGEYLTCLGDIQSPDKLDCPHEVEMFSTVTGQIANAATLESAEHWVRNLVMPVKFTESVLSMCFLNTTEDRNLSCNKGTTANGISDIVEIGPHGALQSAVKQIIKEHDGSSTIGFMSALDRNSSALGTILNLMGSLSIKGYKTDIMGVNSTNSSVQAKMLVTLPPYSFNHSARIWHESRVTKNYRFRKHPKHDLFGTTVIDWNSEEPRWRYVIRLSENPWLKDHVISGNFIYPGVGFLVMAMEAAKQNSSQHSALTGFRLRNIVMKSALIVPDTRDGIEVMMYMSRLDESSREKSKIWWGFRIMSFNSTGNDWSEHCTGNITIEFATEANIIDKGLEAERESVAWRNALGTTSAACLAPRDMARVYENMKNLGLTFGPLFKNVSDIKSGQGSGQAIGLITIPDIAACMPKNFLYPHVIHPCTIDSMLQLFLPSVLDSAGKDTLSAPLLPTFLREVWVSSNIASDTGHKFRGHSKSAPIAAQKYESDIAVWDGEVDEIKVLVKGLITVPLVTGVNDTQSRNLCYSLEWKPDLDMLKSGRVLNATPSTLEEDDKRRIVISDLQLASVLLITDALNALKDFPADDCEGHFKRYYQWMSRQITLLQSDSIIHLPLERWMKYKNDTNFKKNFYEYVSGLNAEGALCIRMGSNIARMMRKEVDPLYLMFGMDDLMNKLYAEMVSIGNIRDLTRAYAEVIGHNVTDLNILEIGAGTGSSTEAFLEILNPLPADERSHIQESRIAKYTFTDISAAFFEKAKERYKAWGDILEFRTLNIAKHPQEQGLNEGEYDIIVAGNVLHATPNLQESLTNVKYLLKPGGKLIMHESVKQGLVYAGLIFGTLPGWWLGSEDIRTWGPRITENEWDKVLREAGFSGIELSLKDYPHSDLHSLSLLVSSKPFRGSTKRHVSPKIFILTMDCKDRFAPLLAETIAHKHGLSCSVVEFANVTEHNLTDACCIALMELDQAVLSQPTDDTFSNLKYLLTTCKEALWVTGDTTANPEMNMIAGLMRVIRWERNLENPNLISLSVSNTESPNSILLAILDIFEHQFLVANKRKENADYLFKGDIILTNRLVGSAPLNTYLTLRMSEPIPQKISLGQAETDRSLRLTTGAPGMLNKLQFETDPIWYTPLGQFDVEVKVKAVGLNFRDIMIAVGEHDSLTFGNEGAGIVTRVGASVKKVHVGDHVCFVDGESQSGTFQTYGRVSEDFVTPIPEKMSFEIASSLLSVYTTALYGLYRLARLSKGETILIHSAAGGVGQAAITLANLVGAEVFATVSSPEKAELLMKEYNVRRDHIFSSRDYLFAKSIVRMTNGKGVDVVLNSLAGEYLRRTWECIAPFGRFIEIGKKDALNDGRITLKPFLKNVVFASVELQIMKKLRPKDVASLMEETIQLYTDGKIKAPNPLKIVDYSHLEESFRALQSGKGMGKFVLVPTKDAVVPVVPSPLKPIRLEEHASYVLSGGLGIVGRSLALWMASVGARNLIFLSRSGDTSPDAKKVIQDLQSQGVRTGVFICDVSDKSSLETVTQRCQATFPPIKGCIQGAMVLRDKLFENMTHEDYLTTIKPKVQGSWNLHTCLPKDMDFFILLSSLNALLGSRAQANYAAGNTYQDALAAHRISIGLPATSLNLGALLANDHGVDDLQRFEKIQKLASILRHVHEGELHRVIEYCMDPDNLSIRPTQVALGLSTANQYLTQGVPLPLWMQWPLFSQLSSTRSAAAGPIGDEDADAKINIASHLGSMTSMGDTLVVITDAIRSKLSKLLSIPLENIDPTKSVSSHGVDSLVATEFRTWLSRILGADIPLLEILGTIPIAGASGLSMKAAFLSKLVPESIKTDVKMPE